MASEGGWRAQAIESLAAFGLIAPGAAVDGRAAAEPRKEGMAMTTEDPEEQRKLRRAAAADRRRKELAMTEEALARHWRLRPDFPRLGPATEVFRDVLGDGPTEIERLLGRRATPRPPKPRDPVAAE
jgi:hypothetical protein